MILPLLIALSAAASASSVKAPAPPAPVPLAGPSSFRKLEVRILGALGLPPAPGGARAWVGGTAELLRSHPSLSLPQAMAAGFASAYALPPERRERIAAWLEGGPGAPSPQPAASLNGRAPKRLFAIGGELYAAHDGELSLLRGKDWMRPTHAARPDLTMTISPEGVNVFYPGLRGLNPIRVGWPRQALEHRGRWYLVADKRLFEKGGAGWQEAPMRDPSNRLAREVHAVREYRGSLYAATSDGVFRLDAAAGRWKPVAGMNGSYTAMEVDSFDRLSLFAEGGHVSHFDGDSFRGSMSWPLFGTVAQTVVSGGAVYLRNEAGVLFVRRGLAHKVLEWPRAAKALWGHDGDVFVLDDEGVWRISGQPLLPRGWEAAARRALYRELNRARPSPPLGAQDSRVSDLHDEHGREIFSGLSSPRP